MDIDLDLDTDNIREFLQTKLAEIKTTNEKLETALKYREETALKLNETRINNIDDKGISWGSMWKKINNDKYIVGLGLQNKTACCAENIKVILNWSLSSALNYKSFLISEKNENLLCESLKWKLKDRQAAQIILVFDVPLFTEELACTVSVSITFQQNNKKGILNFPSTIQLISEDTTNSSVEVQMHKVIDGNTADLLSLIFSLNKYEFVMVFDDNWNRLLETILLVDCSLSQINKKLQGKCFLAYKICSALDGALLEVVGDDDDEDRRSASLSIYCRDEGKLVACLHYLHKHISNVAIVPKHLYTPHFHLEDPVELAKKALSKEIDYLRENSENLTAESRILLANLEHETDVVLATITQRN